MIVLGINAYHADAAAAIVRDGVLVAAVEEERFNRVKHSAGFPYSAVDFCLRQAGVEIEDVELQRCSHSAQYLVQQTEADRVHS